MGYESHVIGRVQGLWSTESHVAGPIRIEVDGCLGVSPLEVYGSYDESLLELDVTPWISN